MAEAGPDIVGVDWRTPLAAARLRVGPEKGLQGNLDPVTLLGPWEAIESEVLRILSDAATAGGRHIFNIGHGVLPETDPTVIARVVDLIHRTTR